MVVKLISLTSFFLLTFSVNIYAKKDVNTHLLPGIKSLKNERDLAGSSFKLMKYSSKNHNLSDVGKNLIIVHSNEQGWLDLSVEDVPPYPLLIPAKLQRKIQLMYSKITGWVILPKKWVLWNYRSTFDGASYFEFRRSDAANEGWALITVSSPCGGCGTSEVAGLIPAASSAFRLAYQEIPGIAPPNERLSPRPVYLRHLDPCTALIAYKKDKLIVNGAVVLSTYPNGEANEVESFYIGLPAGKRYLGKRISKEFLKSQMRRHFYKCVVNRHQAQG